MFEVSPNTTEEAMNRTTLSLAISLTVSLASATAHASDPCSGLFDAKGKLLGSKSKTARDDGKVAQCLTRLESQRKNLDRTARAKTQQTAQAISFKPVSSGQLDDASSGVSYLQATAKGACRLKLEGGWAHAIPFGYKTGSTWSFGKHNQVQGHDVNNLDMRRYIPEAHGQSGVSGYSNPIPSSNTNPENYFVRFRDAGTSSHSFQFALKVVRRPDEDPVTSSLRTQRVQQGLARLSTMQQKWTAAVNACEDLDKVDAKIASLGGSKSRSTSKSSTRSSKKSRR